METWEKMERLRELVGDKEILDELLQWVNSDTLDRFADDYISMYDLEDEFPELQEDEDEDLAEENYDNKTS